jgi:hypothetical protein
MMHVGDGTGPESIVIVPECIPSENGAVETSAFAEGASLTIAEVVDSQVLGLEEPAPCFQRVASLSPACRSAM